MRTAFVLTAAAAAALSLSACQKPAANNAAANTASAAGATPAAAPAGVGETPITMDQMPHRKAGLWKIHTTISDIGRGMDDTQCVGSDTDKIDWSDKKQMGNHNCNPTFGRSLDGSYHGTATCTIEGSVKMAMDIRAAGDFDSHYHVHVENTVSGAPIAQLNGKHVSDMDAVYAGPCTPSTHGGD